MPGCSRFSKVFRWQPCVFKDCNSTFKELTNIDKSGRIYERNLQVFTTWTFKTKAISYHKLGLKFQIWKQLTALISHAKDTFTPWLIGRAWKHVATLSFHSKLMSFLHEGSDFDKKYAVFLFTIEKLCKMCIIDEAITLQSLHVHSSTVPWPCLIFALSCLRLACFLAFYLSSFADFFLSFVFLFA